MHVSSLPCLFPPPFYWFIIFICSIGSSLCERVQCSAVVLFANDWKTRGSLWSVLVRLKQHYFQTLGSRTPTSFLRWSFCCRRTYFLQSCVLLLLRLLVFFWVVLRCALSLRLLPCWFRVNYRQQPSFLLPITYLHLIFIRVPSQHHFIHFLTFFFFFRSFLITPSTLHSSGAFGTSAPPHPHPQPL